MKWTSVGLARAWARESSLTAARGDGTMPGVGSKRERQADRALVAAYHEARLGELVERVAEAVDRFRACEQNAFAVDEVIHQYHRAAQELWNFCWLGGAGAKVKRTARVLRDMAARDERADCGSSAHHANAAPRGRRSMHATPAVRHRLAWPAAPLDLR